MTVSTKVSATARKRGNVRFDTNPNDDDDDDEDDGDEYEGPCVRGSRRWWTDASRSPSEKTLRDRW